MSKQSIIAVFCAALACATIGLPPVPASADVTRAEDGKRKINLSGRQRMLSQRMAKAVCFAQLGIEAKRHRAMAVAAHDLFDETLQGLRRGSAAQGMNEERHPQVLAELDGVDGLWRAYGPAVIDAAQTDAASPAMFAEVAMLNVPTLAQMNAAVAMFERHYGTDDIHPALALAINVSGRQRMLTQKASKEFCLIASGYEAAANRAALADTLALFEASLAALRHGDDVMGLPPAPTPDLIAQLALVHDLWEPLRAVFATVSDGAVPTDGDIAIVAGGNDEVLREMNRAVGMYEAL